MKNFLLSVMLITAMFSCSQKHVNQNSNNQNNSAVLDNPTNNDHDDMTAYIAFLEKDVKLDDLDLSSKIKPLFVKKLSTVTNSWLIDLSTIKTKKRGTIIRQIEDIKGIKRLIIDAPLEPR